MGIHQLSLIATAPLQPFLSGKYRLTRAVLLSLPFSLKAASCAMQTSKHLDLVLESDSYVFMLSRLVIEQVNIKRCSLS